MRKYPEIGEQVRVKNETGLLTVKAQGAGIHGKPYVILEGDRLVHLGDIITRHQKWITLYVVQQHYGNGWEDVTQEEIISEAIQRRREYRENTPYPTRLIRRKEPNQLYRGE